MRSEAIRMVERAGASELRPPYRMRAMLSSVSWSPG